MTTQRQLVLVGAAVGLLFVYARLIEHHYYHLTWAACARGSSADLCGSWRMQALIEALIVIGAATAAWIWFGMRKASEG